jgi:hypothetical protein
VPSTGLVEAVVVGTVVVVVVVVLIGGTDAVGLLVAATCGCVVALTGVDVPGDVLDAPGFSDADFGRGADDTAPVLELVVELAGPLDNDDDDDDDDDGNVDGATIGSRALDGRRALDTPELGGLLVGASGVVGSPVTADEVLGEPGASARYTKINTMPNRPAIPIPFCKGRILTTYPHSRGRSRFACIGLDISWCVVPILPCSVACRSKDLSGLRLSRFAAPSPECAGALAGGGSGPAGRGCVPMKSPVWVS